MEKETCVLNGKKGRFVSGMCVPTLYHGTPRKNLRDILSKGLLSSKSGSRSEGVYLSDDKFTARNYAPMHDVSGDDFVLLKIDSSKLDIDKLEPDDYEFPELAEDRGWNEARIYDADWRDSLKISTQVIYLGDIPPKAISVENNSI